MSNDTIVSVCCITYNQEAYIDDCIKSILSQNFPYGFEIIIGDDCSSDGTRNKLKKLSLEFPDKINVIYNDKNLGPNGNILSVFQKAKGKYIAFCEGDDFWIDDYKLHKQYNILKENPDKDFCFHRAYMEKDTLRLEHFNYGNVQKTFSVKDVLKVVGQFAPTASYMLKRSVVEKLPSWFSECSIGDLFLELYSMENGGIYLPDAMSVYRVNSVGSWSETIKNDISIFTERHLNIVRYLTLAKLDFPACSSEFNIKLANVYLNMCTRFLFIRDYKHFRQYLREANRVNNNFTRKQKVYNNLKYLPQMIYFIHYLNSFARK